MPAITEHEMTRRKMVARAGSDLLDAMISFTDECGELTACEWIQAVNEAIVRRVLAQELRDQWSNIQ